MQTFHAANGTIEGEHAPPVLVVTGPYGYVRNPLLVAYLMVLIGETLLTGLPELIVFTVLLWMGMSIWHCCRCASPTACGTITSAISLLDLAPSAAGSHTGASRLGLPARSISKEEPTLADGDALTYSCLRACLRTDLLAGGLRLSTLESYF